ncbi:MAG: vitamin K epoxide reductase family protein [Thermoanaerobaculia bacterium]
MNKARGPDARSCAKLAALGALSALWSLFLWAELVVVRSGGSAFCGFGGRFDCNAVWSSAFASAVHGWTGLPLAGWGLVWSLVAFVLPLVSLLRLAEGRPASALVSGVRLTAAAGILAVAVFIAESAIEGAVCIGCIGTYVLAAAYAGVALWRWRPLGFPDWKRGATLAAACTAGAFALLLYPGLHTPRSAGEAGRRAVTEAAGRSLKAAPTGTGDMRRDKALEDLVASLDPSLKQTLSDSLFIYRTSPERPLPAPRALVGSDLARIRIAEFTDVLCEHCADLHQTLRTLSETAAPGAFSVDSRQFPLDGRCNPVFGPGTGEDVRCLGAKARICVEPTGRGEEFAAALFARQKGLTRQKVLETAVPFLSREALGACLDSAATRQKLEEDIAAAASYDTDGTPLVVVNGRRGTSFGPFLYALILTRGAPDHPAFASLPPPNPAAHLH